MICIFIEVGLFLKGWMILFVLPTCHQGRSTECPPRRRRGARVADSPGGVGGAECDLEMFWGNNSKMYHHTCLYDYTYLFLFQVIKFSILTYIYINIHVFWSWFTYSMRLYIHSRWFNFSSWGKQVLMGNLHLFGGDVQKTLPLKGAWKNDGFIVSSTYFLLMVFFTGDMNSKQPCFVFGVEIWWFYDLDVLIGVFVVFV